MDCKEFETLKEFFNNQLRDLEYPGEPHMWGMNRKQTLLVGCEIGAVA